jgi:hypothetical protein
MIAKSPISNENTQTKIPVIDNNLLKPDEIPNSCFTNPANNLNKK